MLLFKGAKQVDTLLHMCNVLDFNQFLKIKFVHNTRKIKSNPPINSLTSIKINSI